VRLNSFIDAEGGPCPCDAPACGGGVCCGGSAGPNGICSGRRSHEGAEARHKQREEPTTRHKGSWCVPCSCICAETELPETELPWLPSGLRCFALAAPLPRGHPPCRKKTPASRCVFSHPMRGGGVCGGVVLGCGMCCKCGVLE
jgi:hypothetical protein